MKHRVHVLAALLLLSGAACTEQKQRATKLQSFRVSLQTSGGSVEEPLAYSATPRDFVLDIEALDSRGQRLTTFEGLVRLSAVPGEVTGVDPTTDCQGTPSPCARLTGGVATGLRVSMRRGFGPTRILAEDSTGTNPEAIGASGGIYFQNPRIRDIQQPSGSRDTSPLVGTVVTVDRGNNIVAHVSNAGFHVVDRADDAYNSVFAFNFSRPDGIRRGDKVKSFGGQVLEFLGYTELGFPSWDIDFRCPTADNPGQVCDEGQFCVAGACLGLECGDRVCSEGSVCKDNACVPNANIPDPKDVSSFVTTNTEMEKYEGGFVKLTNVITSQEFKDCDDPTQNPGANGNGTCEFCRTCNANRDANGACASGGRCCPVGQVCNTAVGECTVGCDADRDSGGVCPTGKSCCIDGACNLSLGQQLHLSAGICGGCTRAEKAEAACESECQGRGPGQKLCTNTCDFRDFNQYRAGLTDEEGNWNGKSVVLVTSDTLPGFRPTNVENLGTRLPAVKGILSNIYAPTSTWIVTPRDECDVEGLERRRTDCATVK